jgi:hypothetical protein
MTKKALLIALVLLGMGGAIAKEALAMEVDRGGFGDALLIPYFDVNNLNTLISIESNNMTFQVVRVRFRSATTGVEALAFNLCLAPTGSWTAAMSSNGATAQIVSSSPMLADGMPGLNQLLAGDTTRGHIEIIGLREGGATQAICTDPSQGAATSNFSLLARTYYVDPSKSPILAFGTNAVALRGFSTVKLSESVTMFGNSDVAAAVIAHSNFSGTALSSRYFVDPNFAAETIIVLAFPSGAGGCSACTIPSHVLITPFAEDGTQLPSLSRPAGQVVNVIGLTAADLSSPAGLFLLTATPVNALPAVGLVIQTTASQSGPIFFNVLFQGQLF